MCGAGVWKKGQGTKGTRFFVCRLGLEYDCFAALACCVGNRDFAAVAILFGAVDGNKFCKRLIVSSLSVFYSAEFETDLRSIDVGFGSVLLSPLLLQTRFTVKVVRSRRRRRTWIFYPVFSCCFFCSDIAQKFGFKKFPKFWLLCV
jgi:hypothetical protein